MRKLFTGLIATEIPLYQPYKIEMIDGEKYIVGTVNDNCRLKSYMPYEYIPEIINDIKKFTLLYMTSSKYKDKSNLVIRPTPEDMDKPSFITIPETIIKTKSFKGTGDEKILSFCNLWGLPGINSYKTLEVWLQDNNIRRSNHVFLNGVYAQTVKEFYSFICRIIQIVNMLAKYKEQEEIKDIERLELAEVINSLLNNVHPQILPLKGGFGYSYAYSSLSQAMGIYFYEIIKSNMVLRFCADPRCNNPPFIPTRHNQEYCPPMRGEVKSRCKARHESEKHRRRQKDNENL